MGHMVEQMESLDPDAREFISEMVFSDNELDPADFNVKFAKSLYLKVTPDGRIPVVACILSLIRLMIVHGKHQPREPGPVIKELEDVCEEPYVYIGSRRVPRMMDVRAQREAEAASSELNPVTGFVRWVMAPFTTLFQKFRWEVATVNVYMVPWHAEPVMGGYQLSDLDNADIESLGSNALVTPEYLGCRTKTGQLLVGRFFAGLGGGS